MIVIFSNSYGGTERRFCRYFDFINKENNENILFINEELYERVYEAEIIKNPKNIILAPQYFKFFIKTKRFNSRFLKKTTFLLSKFDLLTASMYFVFALIKYKPSVLHLVLGGVYLSIVWMPVYFGKKIITMPSIDLEKLTDVKSGIFLNLVGLKLSNIIDVLTPSAVSEILQHGIDKSKIRICPCSFTDTCRFKPGKKEKTVVFAGRLETYHRPIMFLDAIGKIKRHDIKFKILGKGSEELKIKNYILQHLSDYDVELLFKSDISDELEKALVFVSLKDENYPSQSLIEAMSSGCAIIATKGKDSNLLVDKKVGYLIDFNRDELAERIVDLVDNFQETINMGMKSREFIIENHSIFRFHRYISDIWSRG